MDKQVLLTVEVMKNEFHFLRGDSQEQSPFKPPNKQCPGMSGKQLLPAKGGRYVLQ